MSHSLILFSVGLHLDKFEDIIPELKVDDSLNADLWDVVVVEERVCYA